MNLIPVKFKPTIQFSLSEINQKYLDIKYPIIIKPIICSGGGVDIKIINSDKELKIYLLNCKDKNNFMVQNYLHDYNVEIGVLWEKQPWQKEGKVIEIVEKTQKKGIRPFDHNNYKNHPYLINKKLNLIFNDISMNIKNMNVCRYDIRLKNIEDLQNGNFKIVEVNGTMGMPFLGYPIKYGFIIDVNWYLRRLIIGLYNIITLHGYSPLTLPIIMFKSFFNMINCKDWENIYSYYS
jgi:D-alanine-D-alanine ligase-like ATP-grasp enzyme